MVIFILAAISSYLLFRRGTTSEPIAFARAVAPAPLCWHWRRDRFERRMAAAALFALVVALYASLAGPSEYVVFYEFQNAVRHIADAPEILEALLGALAGVMCRALPPWRSIISGLGAHRDAKVSPRENEEPDRNTSGSELSMGPLLLFAGALASVILAAMLAPYASTLLDRTSGVDTPYVKVQFATSAAERQLALNVERDIEILDKLEDFPRSLRLVQYDCGQAVVDDARGIAALKVAGDQFETFQMAIAFRMALMPYVNAIVEYQRKRRSIDMLTLRVKPVAEKFERLVLLASSGADHAGFAAAYIETMVEIAQQQAKFKSEGIGDELSPEEKDRRKRDDDPHWCDPPGNPNVPREPVAAKDFQRLAEETRYVFGAASAFLNFIGDTGGVIRIWSLAKANPILSEDINVNDGLALSLYTGKRDFAEIFRLIGVTSHSVDEMVKAVDKFDPRSDPDDQNIKKALKSRYKRVRFMTGVRKAYLWAQMGLEDVWPPPQVPWSDALKYAEDARKNLPMLGDARFTCTDDDFDLRVHDTYAFVRLAFEAHKLQTYRIRPDQQRVRDARVILDDLRASVLEMQQSLKTRSLNEALSHCLNEAEADAWMKRLSSHVKLADALQR